MMGAVAEKLVSVVQFTRSVEISILPLLTFASFNWKVIPDVVICGAVKTKAGAVTADFSTEFGTAPTTYIRLTLFVSETLPPASNA